MRQSSARSEGDPAPGAVTSATHLPKDKQQIIDRAKRLEWITIAFMVSIIAVIGLTMGSSEAMKAIWVEDVLSLVPPIAFLVGTRYFDRPPDVDGKPDKTPDKVQHELERLDWVQKARVRLREDGDVLTGEAFIVPKDETDLLNRLKNAYDVANGVDWRLHDVNIVPVRSLE